jgi:hypothetical protein
MTTAGSRRYSHCPISVSGPGRRRPLGDHPPELTHPLQLPRLDPGREDIAEPSADPTLQPKRCGTLLHIDDDARVPQRSPPSARNLARALRGNHELDSCQDRSLCEWIARCPHGVAVRAKQIPDATALRRAPVSTRTQRIVCQSRTRSQRGRSGAGAIQGRFPRNESGQSLLGLKVD